MNRLNSEQTCRLKKLLKTSAYFLGVGLAYLIWVLITDLRIPCIFVLTTGKYCPGCGITRMIVDIVRMDFYAAMSHNVLVFFLMPLFFVLAIIKSIQYVREGKTKDSTLEKIIYIFVFVLCVTFWVMRNMPGYSFLAP